MNSRLKTSFEVEKILALSIAWTIIFTFASCNNPKRSKMITENGVAPTMVTEIRVYKLKTNMSEKFTEVFTKQSLPILKRWKVDVVDFGFSLVDPNSFYLIRNYQSIEQRELSQKAFYGSDEWINGPEKDIMDCIETYYTTVVDSRKLTVINQQIN
jgi:hypothetical protein